MCTYLHRHTSGLYYFRMSVPAPLRPMMGGRREIKHSLGTKDRDTAKAMIPDHTKSAHKELQAAREASSLEQKPVKSRGQLAREDARFAFDVEQAELIAAANDDLDDELESLEPVMDALAVGQPVEASAADIARAVQLLVIHEREKASIDKAAAITALSAASNARPSGIHNQAVEWGNDAGTPLYPDIFNRWQSEGHKRPKTIAMVKASCIRFHDSIGSVPVEQVTKANVIAFKNHMVEAGQSISNANIRLSHISALLGWAARNGIVPSNVALGTSIPNPQSRKSRRKPFKLPELKEIFGSPVFSEGVRPAGGKGEAAYWIPTIALYTGARVREIAQLRCGDIRDSEFADGDGNMRRSWFFSIAEDTDEAGLQTAIKTDASERLVPVHPKLIELGFIDYVQKLSDQKGRVFPLLPVDIYGNPAAIWGEWFSGYLRKVCGVVDKRMTFHSFRHTFKDYARDARIEEGIQRQIMGHEGGDVADSYGSGYSLHIIVDAIAAYRVPGLILTGPK